MGGLGKLPIGRHRGTKSSNPASLQRRVRVSRDFALPRREGGFSRGCVGPAGAAWSAETAIARCMAPTGGNISVGPNSSTAASMRWSTPLAPSPHWQCSGFVIRLRRCQCVSSCPKMSRIARVFAVPAMVFLIGSATRPMLIIFLCGCQSGAQLPPTPVIGATCQTLAGSCLLLTPPPSGGGCTCPDWGTER